MYWGEYAVHCVVITSVKNAKYMARVENMATGQMILAGKVGSWMYKNSAHGLPEDDPVEALGALNVELVD